MITFVDLWVDNFAGYLDTSVDFATGSDRPLTLLRGENQSGKTTLLRAFVWVVYGMDAMPKSGGGTHPVRPDFLPDGEQVHRGRLVFTHAGSRGEAVFRLTREVVTDATGPRVVKIAEQERLERLADPRGDWHSGDWEDASGQLVTLRRSYFQPELKDIIFADADKSEEFVGGAESSHSNELMEKSVTSAIYRLLGIDVLTDAVDRTEKASRKIRDALDKKQEGTSDLPGLRADRDRLKQQRDEVRASLQSAHEQRLAARARLEEAELQRKQSEHALATTRPLQEEVRALEREAENHRRREQELLGEISDSFHDSALPAALMMGKLRQVANHLGVLKDEGVLPPGEVTVVPRILDDGICICGTPVPEGSDARHKLEHLLTASRAHLEERTALDEIRVSLSTLMSRAANLDADWRTALEDRVDSAVMAAVDARRVEQTLSARSAELEKAGRGNEKIDAAREHIKQLREDLNRLSTSIATAETQLGARFEFDAQTRKLRQLSAQETSDPDPLDDAVVRAGLISKVSSLSKQIAKRERDASRATVEEVQLRFSEDVKKVISGVLDAVRTEQVPSVSSLMHDVYTRVMESGDASLTAEVRIEPTTHGYRDRDYELVALNRAGHRKELGYLAGSERRTVATAFLLALVRGSGTRVPFVSDSLLHSVSGVVRTNLLSEIVDSGSQSVMFALRSDLAAPHDREIVRSAAGRTYTITSQAHVPEKVVRKAESASDSVSVLCRCGPGLFCEACERHGDASDDSLRRADSTEIVN